MSPIRKPPQPPVVPPRPPTPPPEPPAPTTPASRLGSYGNASIDQHDPLFLAAAEAVLRKKGVRVDPRFVKAMMEVESGGDGNYPPSRCRPADSYGRVPACGPMQIKQRYHQQRCPECDFGTLAGQIELAFHIIGDAMKERRTDEAGALLAVYFPGDDANGTTQAAYLARVRTLVAAMAADAGEPDRPEPPTAPGYDFSFRGWPAGFDRRIVAKGPSGQGWDALGDRSKSMVGIVSHITDGTDDRDAIVRLFGPGGGRYGDALTEAVIDRSGLGYLMNDPWSADPMEGSGRTPWASGPANGLDGPGVPFVQKLGANAVNHRNFATEHCNKEGQAFTDAQIDLSAKVNAVVITREEIPWDAWPINPRVGLYVALKHSDFSTKSCPGRVWRQGGFHDAYVRAVQIEAKKLQTGNDLPPPVAPPKPPTEPDWPFAFTPEQVAAFWGAAGGLRRQGAAGRFPFDPAGPIAAMWLARARREGRFPAALEWWADASGWNFVSFGSAGDADWLLAIPTLDGRADWRWVDKPPEGS